MKILNQILLLSLFCGCLNLTAQGEFYTINHDTKVMLKTSKKADPLKHYYSTPELEDVLIFRNELDRPIKLRGSVDLISNNIDFELLGLKHSIPLESVDSVYVGVIPNNMKGMEVVKYLNGNLFDEENNYYLELIEDGELKLLK